MDRAEERDGSGRVDPTARTAHASARASVAFAFLIGVLIVATLLVLRGRTRAPEGSRRVEPVGSAGPGRTDGRRPPDRVVRDVVRGLLSEPSGPRSWTVISARPEHPPRVAFLTPSYDWMVDGGDLPALVMPPPCEVRFVIQPEDGPVRLSASAGVHFFSRAEISLPKKIETRVQFEVLVDGERRGAEEIALKKGDKLRTWRHLGGPGDSKESLGIELRPGQVVTLRTALSPADALPSDAPELMCGFGMLTLERSHAEPPGRASREAPGIVLIVMDTQRFDRLSCYGHPGGLSPSLDRLAARGTVFEQAYSTASWTLPSTASILTGLDPESHGVLKENGHYLLEELDTLAEALERCGYATAAFSGNPLITPGRNFDQGFETFDAGFSLRKSHLLVPAVEEWLALHAGWRFFLYLHLVDTHHPFDPRPEDAARLLGRKPEDLPRNADQVYSNKLRRGAGHTESGQLCTNQAVPSEHQRWIEESYDACVASGDYFVGRILDRLAELGLEDETVVAFTSDHGEEFFEHGLLGHTQSLHRELVQVPLILAGPGIRAGARVLTPVSNRHLAPTLARVAGASFRGAAGGIDLAAPGNPTAEPVFFSTEKGWWNGPGSDVTIFGMRDEGFSLHWAPNGFAWGADRTGDPGPGQAQLFDAVGDASEHVDLAASRTDLAHALRERIVAHRREAQGRRPSLTLGRAEATDELLRRLGYIGHEEDGEPRAEGKQER